MAALPPLSTPDAALLTRFLQSHEDPLALTTSPGSPDLLTILTFLARPDITPWLEQFHALQARARHNAAANILLQVLRDATDPTQRRLAATALMGQSRQQQRPLDRPTTPPPRAHAARTTTPRPPHPITALIDPKSERVRVDQPATRDGLSAPDATHHRHPLSAPAPTNQPPTPASPPAPAPLASSILTPSAPPCLRGSLSTTDSINAPMTFEKAMAALGYNPALLDLADEIEDAALDGDLADTLEPAALSGALGPALQHAAEQGNLENALEQAIDNGDHLADPAIATAFTAATQSTDPHSPDG